MPYGVPRLDYLFNFTRRNIKKNNDTNAKQILIRIHGGNITSKRLGKKKDVA